MDDQRFDDIIKEKMGDYEAPGFDPSALSALHHQMGALTVWPWYSRYRTELLLGSGLFLCTLIILWNQWSFSNRGAQALKKNDLLLKSQQVQIDNLQHEIVELKSLAPDTIRIIEFKEQSSHLNSVYLQQIKTLEQTIQKMKDANLAQVNAVEPTTASLEVSSGPNWKSAANGSFYENQFTGRLVPRKKGEQSAHAIPNKSEPDKITSRKLSAETIRDLEKHYRNGIGIRVGPALEISRGFYHAGNSRADLVFGVLGDFIVSPSFSVETGAKYTHRFYEITNKEALAQMELPGVDANLGPVVNADIDSWVLEIPLNLKYRYPLSMKTHLLAGVGYSSLMYTKQVFENYYELNSDPLAQINTTHAVDKFNLNPGMLNFSIGLSKEMKNKKLIETSLYYQYGLGEIGVEKMGANFLGIRGTYWFTLK